MSDYIQIARYCTEYGDHCVNAINYLQKLEGKKYKWIEIIYQLILRMTSMKTQNGIHTEEDAKMIVIHELYYYFESLLKQKLEEWKTKAKKLEEWMQQPICESIKQIKQIAQHNGVQLNEERKRKLKEKKKSVEQRKKWTGKKDSVPKDQWAKYDKSPQREDQQNRSQLPSTIQVAQKRISNKKGKQMKEKDKLDQFCGYYQIG